MNVPQLAREVLLVQVRTTGEMGRLGRGHAPAPGGKMELLFRVHHGVELRSPTEFIALLAVDCRVSSVKGSPDYGRFLYRGFAQYRTEQAFPEEVIQEFCRTNSMIHLWPYARASIQASAGRLGLAAITLPAFRVQSAQPE